MEKTTLQVSGMTCGHCEKAVKTALLGVEGVADVAVSLKSGKVDVEFDSAKVSMEQLKEAVEDQGYDVA
jgi:copper chaperone